MEDKGGGGGACGRTHKRGMTLTEGQASEVTTHTRALLPAARVGSDIPRTLRNRALILPTAAAPERTKSGHGGGISNTVAGFEKSEISRTRPS